MHTFALLAGSPAVRGWVSEKTASGKARWAVCAGIWTFVVFIGAIGPVVLENLHPENGPYCIFLEVCLANEDDQVGPGWCWIAKKYDLERIVFHYSLDPVGKSG
jgi:hypothetical protein